MRGVLPPTPWGPFCPEPSGRSVTHARSTNRGGATMQRRSKTLAILTAGTASHRRRRTCPSRSARPGVPRKRGAGHWPRVRGMHPGEFPPVSEVGATRRRGPSDGSRVGLRLGHFPPTQHSAPERGRHPQERPQHARVQRPEGDSEADLFGPDGGSEEALHRPGDAEKFVEHFTSLSRSDITSLRTRTATRARSAARFNW